LIAGNAVRYFHVAIATLFVDVFLFVLVGWKGANQPRYECYFS